MSTRIHKIIPHLWYDTEAKEAAEFYVSVFHPRDSAQGKSKITNITTLEDTPSGTVDVVSFELSGQPFQAISLPAATSAAQAGAGPLFKFNESISFIVSCDTQEEIDYFWGKLSAVPESDLPAPRPGAFYIYVILCDDDSMYIGQTQDIASRWRKHESGVGAEHTKRYKPCRVIHYEEFSSRTDAVKRERELKTGFGRKWLKREYKAGRTRQAGQCGWLKDKYGLSWQIVPSAMDEMMTKGTPEQIARVTQAFLAMKKFHIKELEKAFIGER